MHTIDDLIKILKTSDGGGKRPLFPTLKRWRPQYDFDLIRLAYEYAEKAHEGQARKSGEAYIHHPLETAINLAKMGMDQDSIIAGLLHDVPEDTHYSLVDVEKEFGPDVARLVGGVSKLGIIKYRGVEKQAENLRKMFVSMAEDIRIIVIKMADRLHNLHTLDALPAEKQKRIGEESLEIYASIANRLGMGELKGQLEDLAFPYVYPKEYAWLTAEIMPKVEERRAHLEIVRVKLEKELEDQKVKVLSLVGRTKRLFSLYRKLMKAPYHGDVSKIYDAVALRIIVPSVSDCYKTLGIIHQLWKPLPGRIKDYISQPKPNGYQSLHSNVFTDDGKIIEFQIRTPSMHAQAEYGIAAYWHYDEKIKTKKGSISEKGYMLPKKLQWVKDLVEWQKEMHDHQQYLTSLKLDFFQDRIFVFTPKGDVIDLPEEATPVDFAYHVHTWIGDHCTGAKVNGHIAGLDSKLKNGDVVEIITDKNRKGPSRDWLAFVKTNAAKGKIKAWKAD